MAAFAGNALDALRQWLTQGDTVNPATTGPVLTISTGVAATSLGKAEDDPHVSGDTGVAVWAVRDASGGTSRSDADGDYSPLSVDSGQRLWVRFASGATGPEQTEDASHSTGHKGFQVLGVRADTDATQTSATGDYGFLALDSAGRQKVVSPLTTPTVSFPAAGSQASASIVAASGFRHVCRSISFGLHTVAAPTATTLNVALRDGATGAGAVIRQWGVRVPATADLNVIEVDLSDLSLAGTTNTAMTLEFSAGLASTVQWCNLSTYDIV